MKPSVGFVVTLIVICVALFLLLWPRGSFDGLTHYQSKAMTEAVGLRDAIRSYYKEFSSFPSGSTAEVVSQLASNNVLHIAFIEVMPSSFNKAGEYCDPWDTPYRIAISGTNSELRNDIAIRSAGPDRTFNTDDDIAIP